MKKNPHQTKKPALVRAAERAMKEAVDEVIAYSKKMGIPLAVWKNGKSVFLPPGKTK